MIVLRSNPCIHNYGLNSSKLINLMKLAIYYSDDQQNQHRDDRHGYDPIRSHPVPLSAIQ